jgi:hypothetical protein
VNDAIGGQTNRALEPPEETVNVWLLSDPEGAPLEARVAHWIPMQQNKSSVLVGDIAILAVQGSDRIEPLPLMSSAATKGARFESFGFTADFRGQGRSAQGNIGATTLVGRIELLISESGRAGDQVEGGFSGAPVLVDGYAVGIVASIIDRSTASRGYMIPIEQVLELGSNLNLSVKSRIDASFQHVEPILRRVSRSDKQSALEATFDLRLRTFDSFSKIERVLLGLDDAQYTDEDIKPESLVEGSDRKIILLAPGGSGKSSFLARTIRAAHHSGVVPFLLDLSIKHEPGDTFEKLFNNYTAGGSFDTFNSLVKKDAQKVLLIADGLNERPSADAETILDLISNYLRGDGSRLRVIIADRLQDRRLRNVECEIATVLPLPESEVRSVLGSENLSPGFAQLLSVPFFLDLYLRIKAVSGNPGPSRAEMFERYLRDHSGAEHLQLDQLADAAYEAFQLGKGPRLPEEKWKRLEQNYEPAPNFLAKFKAAGVLSEVESGAAETTGGKELQFRHQLLQDFLVAVSVAKSPPSEWRAPKFDKATLETASFDSIEFAAEILGNRSEEFLREVYDWSWVGVIECIRNLDAERHGRSSPVPPAFRDALYVVNSERIFDRFAHTASRMRSILGDLRTTPPLTLADLTSREDLILRVKKYFPQDDQSEGRRAWRDLYLRESPMELRDIDLLWEDPFTAWTAANVFRRFVLSSEVRARLYGCYQALLGSGEQYPRAVGARWRIVHLLGVCTDSDVSDFLETIVFNDAEAVWVRYGAARSFMEGLSLYAATSREVRRSRLEAFTKRLEEIKEAKVRLAIRQVGILSDEVPDDQGWHEDYLPVLKAGAEIAGRLPEWNKESAAWESQVTACQARIEAAHSASTNTA